MAGNFVQPGDTLTITAPYAVDSGDGVQVGNIFGVALFTALISTAVEVRRVGVWSLTKAASQAWVKDTTRVYWDNTNKVVTSEAAGNLPIGVAAEDVADGVGDTTGKVTLDPNPSGEGGIGVAATATADGTGTGALASKPFYQFVTVTSGNAAHIISLPPPVVGAQVVLKNGGTAYELRSSNPATIAINGGSGASAESAIAANTMVIAICTSATTWQAIGIAGATAAGVEAAA